MFKKHLFSFDDLLYGLTYKSTLAHLIFYTCSVSTALTSRKIELKMLISNHYSFQISTQLALHITLTTLTLTYLDYFKAHLKKRTLL